MITAQELSSALKEHLEKSGESGNAFAKRLGVQQASVSKVKRGIQATFSLDAALKIMNDLGYSINGPSVKATMRRLGMHSPVETVSGDDLVPIPVRLQAGAGGEVDVFSPEPQKIIYVLPRYAQKNVEAVEVTGDSMEPIVKKGAFVGVVPFENLEEGQMYLVCRPPFGLVVKRVITNAAGQIVLRSENKAYEDQIVPNEGYAEIIIGKVVWVWQMI